MKIITLRLLRTGKTFYRTDLQDEKAALRTEWFKRITGTVNFFSNDEPQFLFTNEDTDTSQKSLTVPYKQI